MISYKYLIAFMFIAFTGCKSSVDIGHEKQLIRDILAQERTAHFENNLDLFFSAFADSIISVYHGQVDLKTIEESKKRFEPYFKTARFIKWDDTAEPIINISEDGSMAYAVLKKVVVVSSPDSSGVASIDSTNYAWVSIYSKKGGKWKLVCNVSTQ